MGSLYFPKNNGNVLTWRKVEPNKTVLMVLLKKYPKEAFWMKSLPLKLIRKRYKSFVAA